AEALAPAAPAPFASTAEAAAPRALWRTALPWALFALAVVIAAVALRPRPVVDPDPLRFEIGVPKGLLRITWPRLSPDGRTLAFLGRDDAGKSTIWVRPLDSFEAHPLAGTEGAGRPFWSPDSRELAFFSDRRQLLKISASGGPTQLICEASGGADGTWGPSGVILFDGNASDPIRRCPATGGEASVQVKSDPKQENVYSWPFFLPDGRHFLCTGYPRTGPTEQKIYVGSLDDSAMKPLVASDTRAEYAHGHLVFIVRNTLVAQALDTTKLAVSGDVVPIASGVSASNPGDFSASPSGALAYMAAPSSGSDQLVWVDRKGVELGKEGPPGTYREVALSPDGSRLAYSGSDGTQYDIWV